MLTDGPAGASIEPEGADQDAVAATIVGQGLRAAQIDCVVQFPGRRFGTEHESGGSLTDGPCRGAS